MDTRNNCLLSGRSAPIYANSASIYGGIAPIYVDIAPFPTPNDGDIASDHASICACGVPVHTNTDGIHGGDAESFAGSAAIFGGGADTFGGSLDSTIRVWDLGDYSCRHVVNDHERCVRLRPPTPSHPRNQMKETNTKPPVQVESKRLVVAFDLRASVEFRGNFCTLNPGPWTLNLRNDLRQSSGTCSDWGRYVNSLGIDDDRGLLFSGSSDGTVRVWDAARLSKTGDCPPRIHNRGPGKPRIHKPESTTQNPGSIQNPEHGNACTGKVGVWMTLARNDCRPASEILCEIDSTQPSPLYRV